MKSVTFQLIISSFNKLQQSLKPMALHLRNSKTSFFVIFFIIGIFYVQGQNKLPFWNTKKLQEVLHYAADIGTYALIIQTEEEIVASYGDLETISRVHSVRKAILGALVFQHLKTIKLEASLSDLNIQDNPIPLTDLQQKTKVIHLLKSISGVNHPTGSQMGKMQADRDSLLGTVANVPGMKWAYNNWDYNVLTSILEQEVGLPTQAIFDKGLSVPLNMNGAEVFYRKDTLVSKHAKAGFRLSTRDMVKFGQLFLNKGRWKGKQLLPKEWIEKITQDYTETTGQSNERFGHGYLWWIPSKTYANGLLPKESYVATGAWGQRILVIPKWNTVIAHKTMTEIPLHQRTRVTKKEFEKLVILLSKARN